MNCASARCSRAAGPRNKRETAARKLGAGFEVHAQRHAHVAVVLRLEVEAARACPSAALPHCRFVGAVGHPGLRQVGQAHQHGLQFGLDQVQPFGAGLQFVGDAGHLRHQRAGVLPLALGHADLLAGGVAAGLQLFGAGLDLLAFGFQRAVGGHVQVGLRVLAALQLRHHAGEVTAQEVDVEHGSVFQVNRGDAQRRLGAPSSGGAARTAASRS
jgi:hypothetical protein